MKGITLLLAAIAIIAGSWSHTQLNAKYSYGWFRYISGNPYDPTNYQLVYDDAGCSGLNKLCCIRVTIDWGTFEPDYDALQSLGYESFDFTNVGIYLDGIVKKKP